VQRGVRPDNAIDAQAGKTGTAFQGDFAIESDIVKWGVDSCEYATGWITGVRYPTEARDFSLLHSVQTGSGAHLSKAYKGSFQGVKRPRREIYHLFPSSADIKNAKAIHSLPISLVFNIFLFAYPQM
jgi:hypothetical protein